MKTGTLFVSAVALCLVVLSGARGQTTVLVDDDFAGNPAPNSIGYYLSSDAATTMATSGGDLRIAYTSNQSVHSGPVKSFTAQTLSEVGDKLTLSLKIRSTDGGGWRNGEPDYVRVGFFNQGRNATPIDDDLWIKWQGFGYFAAFGSNGNCGIWEWDHVYDNSSAGVFNGGDPGVNQLDNQLDTDNLPDPTSSAITLTVEVQLTSDGVQISYTSSSPGSTPAGFTDTAAPFTEFNALCVAVERRSNDNEFAIDDVLVTCEEPAAAAGTVVIFR